MTCPCSLGKTECNCAGRPTPEQQRIASDFAELEGERGRRMDYLVNRIVLATVVGIIGAFLLWPAK